MRRTEWADTWLQQGKHDLQAARALRKEGFWDTCALMCQQAAEKAVKALWIDVKSSDPPKVHNVEKLAADLGAPRDVLMAANVLIGDYATSRYPDVSAGIPYDSYASADADDRLSKAQVILAWAESMWEDDDGNQ